jgi:hypothetical protein
MFWVLPVQASTRLSCFSPKCESAPTKAVAQITCPTTTVVFHLRAITPTANATMDLRHSRDIAKYPENTDPQTSGATTNYLNLGISHHVNSTQPLIPPAADARSRYNNTATDVAWANNLSGEVTADVGTFSSMNALDQVEINEQGFAILPVDFFPDKFKNDEEAIFVYRTYNYFPFFDRNQRDEDERPAFVPNDMRNPLPENVDKWKCCYEKVLKSETFRSQAKWAYVQAVAAQAHVAWSYLPNQRQVEFTSIQFAFNLLFDSVSPKLIEAGRLDELVAVAFSMFYAPCLEGNSRWLKDGCRNYFKSMDVKAVLSENTLAVINTAHECTVFSNSSRSLEHRAPMLCSRGNS